MQITHEQAHKMIQYQADFALRADRKRILEAHLDSCESCRGYSESVNRTETLLRRAMTRHWNLRPAPLHIEAINAVYQNNIIKSNLLATRLTVITTAVLMFIVVFVGVTKTGRVDETLRTPPNIPLIPTPSVVTTNTTTNTATQCERLHYTVQQNDTLESIAFEFSVSKADLMKANEMISESVTPGTQMMIPICESTPTGTVHPPTFTTTITPLMDGLSQTPDG